jgi:DNA-binding transcriptional MerR regulator
MQKSADPGQLIPDVTATNARAAVADVPGPFEASRPGRDAPEANLPEVDAPETLGTEASGTGPSGGEATSLVTGGLDVRLGYRGVTAQATAGITYRQLDYWARTGLVVPSVRDASGSGTQRLYSFRDIVVLKVVKRLLDAGVSLQNIRKAIETLRRWGEDDLATMTLISDGTTVYECRSAEEVVDLLQGGQGVFGIAISGAFKEIQGSLAELPVTEPTAGASVPAPADLPNDAAQTGAAVGTPSLDELAARRARRRAG